MDAEPRSDEGGCTCRFVRYRLTSGPLFVHCCHCRWCQRETGASFALNALIEADRAQLLHGEVDVVATPSNSGKGQRIARRRLEQLRRRRRRDPFRSCRHARRSRSAAAGHPHLHRVQAALGRAAARDAGGARVLQVVRAVARAQPRAPGRAAGEGTRPATAVGAVRLGCGRNSGIIAVDGSSAGGGPRMAADAV
jgi:hypothetical protein